MVIITQIFRTLFLFPYGWIKPDINVLYTSPYGRKFKRSGAVASMGALGVVITGIEAQNTRPLKEFALSRDFILLVKWLSITNINVFFLLYTWGQYTRNVDESYQGRIFF